MRAHLALLVAFLLVVGAGCIGTVPRDTASAAMAPNNSTVTTPTTAGTTTNANDTTTTPTGDDSTASDPDDPEGDAESTSTSETTAEGVSSDAERIAAAHVSALREAGSFTRRARVSVEVVGADGTWNASEVLDAEVSFPAQMAVNLGQGRILTNADAGFASSSDYVSFDDGMAYRRYGGAGTETGYRAVPLSECALPASDGELLDRLDRAMAHRFGAAEFAATGTETYDGMEVTQLVAADASTADDRGEDGSTASSARVVVLVDEDGVVRRFEVRRSFEASGMTLRQRVVVEFVDVGETTIEEPPWVEGARK